MRHQIFRASAFGLLLLLVAEHGFGAASVLGVPLPQSDTETLFSDAVTAYNQNRFDAAKQKFQMVAGPHTQEARQYIRKIDAYRESMDAARAQLGRNPDEQDIRSLQYAIDKLQAAMKIKNDGPWEPAQFLEKAQQMLKELQSTQGVRNKASKDNMCQRILRAIRERRYNDAANLSCPLAEDDAAYSCGGNEATFLCEKYSDVADLDINTTSDNSEPNPNVSVFDRARAAYEKNDFKHALSLFQKVNDTSKPQADEYVEKIFRYNELVQNAEARFREGKYKEAQDDLVQAAAIKSDGPGNPRARATSMELMQGLDQFYAGNYRPAIQHLQVCAEAKTTRQSLVMFYLGASKLGQFFITGSEDSTLRDAALRDLKEAKQEGFKPRAEDISPRILRAYNDPLL